MSVDPPPPTRPLYCFRRPGPVRDSVDQAGSRVLGIFWIFKFSGPLSGLGLHSVFGVGKLFHAVLFGTSLRDALRGSFSELLRGLQSSPKQASSVSGALLGTVSAGFCEKLCAGNLSIFPVAPQALSPFRMFSDSSLQSASHYLANVLGAGDFLLHTSASLRLSSRIKESTAQSRRRRIHGRSNSCPPPNAGGREYLVAPRYSLPLGF